MKRFFCMFLAIVIVAAGINCYTPITTKAKLVKKDYIVKLKEKDVDKFTKCYDVEDEIGQDVVTCQLDDSEIKEIDSKYKNAVIEENIEFSGSVKHKKQKRESGEWNRLLIKSQQNTDKNAKSVKVAVIDSGINFINQVEVKQRYNLVEEEDYNYLFEDISGHGTSIAGILNAKSAQENNIEGINSNIELYSIKVLNKENTTTLDRLIEGIELAIDLKVDIINLSMGTKTYSAILEDTIKKADDKGILIVAAAGNGGKNKIVEYPAAFDEVLSVGSVNSEGTISEFSSQNGKVDIYAPGENVSSTAMLNGSITVSGTSIAVPHVVGVASVIWQEHPEASAGLIKSLLISSSNNKRGELSGAGIIDQEYALKKYSEFKKNYGENKAIKIEKNHSKINICENKENVVEASWSRANHKLLISSCFDEMKDFNGKKYKNYKKAEKAMLLGICYNDESIHTKGTSTDKKKTTYHKWWHSLGQKMGDEKKITYNYFANILLVNQLIKTGSCNINKLSKPKGMADYVFTGMKKDLEDSNKKGNNDDKTIPYILKENGLKNTDTNRRYFYWGMLLHIVSDTFAHRSYMKNSNGKWVHVNNQGVKRTDNVSFLPSRYETAGMVVMEIMANCINIEKPYSSKYVRINEFLLLGGAYEKFRLQNFAEFAVEAGLITSNDVDLPVINKYISYKDNFKTESQIQAKYKEVGYGK